MADVPIIGAPSQVVLWYPTTIINCRCLPDRVTLIVVTGFDNHSQCGNCGKLYKNAGMKASDDNGKIVDIDVDVMVPTPAKELM